MVFGCSLIAVWSNISFVGLLSYQHDSIVLWPHPQKVLKWDRPRIFQIPLWNFALNKFPINVWHGGETWGVWRWSFPSKKKIENINNLLIDVQNYPSFHPFVAWQLSYLPRLRVSWVCESDCPQLGKTRDPVGYTRTSTGTCIEKQ